MRKRSVGQRHQQFAIVNDADDVVFGFLIDRQFRVAFGDDDVEHATRRIVDRNRYHLRPRLHHFTHDRIAELHHRMDQLALFFFDHALLGADVDQRANVFFGNVDLVRVS